MLDSRFLDQVVIEITLESESRLFHAKCKASRVRSYKVAEIIEGYKSPRELLEQLCVLVRKQL